MWGFEVVALKYEVGKKQDVKCLKAINCKDRSSYLI